jgi:hypothetical protein
MDVSCPRDESIKTDRCPIRGRRRKLRSQRSKGFMAGPSGHLDSGNPTANRNVHYMFFFWSINLEPTSGLGGIGLRRDRM